MDSQTLNPYAAIYRPSFYVYSEDHGSSCPSPDHLPLPFPPPHQLHPLCSVFSHHFQFSSPMCSPSSVPSFPEVYCYLPSPPFYSAAAFWPRKEVEVVYVTAEPMPPTQSPHHRQRATLTLLADGADGKDGKNPKEDIAAALGGVIARGGAINDQRKISKVIKSEPRRAAQRKFYISKRLQVENFQLDPSILGDNRTTVMIKNIPNKFTKKMLLDILDEHCFLQNEEIWKGKDSAAQSEFDFLYLPVDFKSGSNKGYAFVNFTSADAARRFYDSFHNFKWKTYGSKKTCEVVYARIQGKDALVHHFLNSTFPCSRSDYLPMSFTPPRTGDNGGGAEISQECTIGRMTRNGSLLIKQKSS